MTPKFEPSAYQQAIFDWVVNGRGDAVVQAVAGCLAGDTMIGINRAGKSYQVRLDRLVHMMNGGVASNRVYNSAIPTKVRSLIEPEHQIIGLNEIAAAIYSGEKLTYTVETESGKLVRATADHQFLTNKGWIRLKDLACGDILLSDAGRTRKASKSKPYYTRSFGLKNHAYHHSSGRDGYVWNHRLVAEARLNEISVEEFKAKIRKGNIEDLQFLDPKTWIVHHIDKNSTNNHPDNLQVMTVEEHKNHHAVDGGWRNVQFLVAPDPIKSITEYEIEPTYDLTMTNSLLPNFLANGIVVHNSGKTTTLVQAAKLLNTRKATFVAFNKHVAKELQERLGNSMVCKTIHSVGMGTLRSSLSKVSVDDNKYYDLAKPYAKEIAEGLYARYQVDLRQWARQRNQDIPEPIEPPKAGFITSQLKQLAHYCMVTLTPAADKAAVEEMIDTFTCLDDSLDLKDLHYALQSLLKEGERVAANRGTISYDDMLWLPHQWNLTPNRQEWVYIDESQDLSAAQLDLVLKMRGRGGRMLFVGDPKQAIYGFAGACTDSIERIIKRTKAIVLPLSICYRCPSKHIELAKKYVSQIEPAPNAIEGAVDEIHYNKVHEIVREGDLIVSRCTAPVVKLCIELIGKRIPARVRGRDIGRSLTALVREIATHPEFDFEKFGKFLDEYRKDKIAKLEQKKNSQSQIESLCDRTDGIAACWQAFNSTSIDSFCLEIEELFSDTRSSVILSTVHRAKGLEEKRVFILRPDLLPLRWNGQQDWELEQEYNLCYVALTRAKEALCFIQNEEKSTDDSKAASSTNAD